MARSARDCALMLQVMAGYDPNDLCSANEPVADMSARMGAPLAGLRIGLPRGAYFDPDNFTDEVRAAVSTAVEQMAAAGAQVTETEIPLPEDARAAQRVILLSELYGYHQENLRQRLDRYGRYARRGILPGIFYTAADYVRAQRIRSVVRDRCLQATADVDVLILPTRRGVASPLAGWETFTEMISVPNPTNYWNFVGYTALSVPCGSSQAGLPIGMQIVGKPFADPHVLAVGDAYQALTEWHSRTPPMLKELARLSE
jgi:aspartyl-tRNA(Asn)/glutamyl-tRNA(Gln) amidotransferase subunit A